MMAWLMGISAPPAAPCRIRKKTSAPRFGAMPQRKDENVNMMMQEMRNLFLPNMRASQPVMGMITALLMR